MGMDCPIERVTRDDGSYHQLSKEEIKRLPDSESLAEWDGSLVFFKLIGYGPFCLTMKYRSTKAYLPCKVAIQQGVISVVSRHPQKSLKRLVRKK